MPVRNYRRRYLRFNVEGIIGLDEKTVHNALFDSVSRYFGVNGLSLANLKLIEYNIEERSGIVRCNHSFLREVRVSFALIDHIKGESVCVHVERVSGTIKSLRDKTKSES